MKRLMLTVMVLFAVPALSGGGRRYLVLHTDESKLVLQDKYGDIHVVEAWTYCWEHHGFTEGAVVVSTENLDACTSSVLVAPSGETCKVWCP